MRSRSLFTLLAAFVMSVSAFAFAPTIKAQDGGQQPTGTQCDSTLLLLVWIAETNYGFQSASLDLNSFERGQYGEGFGPMNMGQGQEGQTGTDAQATPGTEGQTGTDAQATPSTEGTGTDQSGTTNSGQGSTGTDAQATPGAEGQTGTDAQATPGTEGQTGTDAQATPGTEGQTGTDAQATPGTEGTDGGMMSGVTLLPGNIPGEDPACSQLRAEVEAFLIGAITSGQGMMNQGTGEGQ